MNSSRVSCKRVLIALAGTLLQSSRATDIYDEEWMFGFGRTLRGSAHPAVFIDGTNVFRATQVSVRWLWTDRSKYFDPLLFTRPRVPALKTIGILSKALASGECHSPYDLVDHVGATIVERVEDAVATYRILRAPGDCDIAVLARASL